MATRGLKSRAARHVKKKAAKKLAKSAGSKAVIAGVGALFSTTGLIVMVVIVALLGAVVAFSGDGEGTGATSETACQSAGIPGPVSDLNLRTISGASVAGLTPAQTANAAVIVQVAAAKGLGVAGAEIGVSVALAEATLFNYANDGTSTLTSRAHGRQLDESERAVARESMGYPHDRVGNNLDSIGLYQQRPMTGWGTPDELINPAVATGKFFDALVGNVPTWRMMSGWVAAQTVQGSPDGSGGIYRTTWAQAEGIVAAIGPLLASGRLDTSGAAVQVATTTASPVTGVPPATSSTVATSTSGTAPIYRSVSSDGGCQIIDGGPGGTLGGGAAGVPVVFNGNLTVNAPSGAYTVKLPDGPRGAFLQAVATKMGTSYVWGAAGPDVFDCSGLMSWGLTQAGVGVGRKTADNFWRTTLHIAAGTEQPGDIVLFSGRYSRESGMAGHIGVVIDAQQKLMMHTYTTGKPATISRYDTWSRGEGPIGFAQVIAAGPAGPAEADVAPGVLVAAGN